MNPKKISNSMNQDDDDFEHDDDDEELEEFDGVYVLDEETTAIVVTAIGCLEMLASVQIDENARINLETIAQEMAARFAIDSIELEEEEHEGEYILKPLGGVFGSDEEESPKEANDN